MVYYSETETGRPSESGVLDFGSDNKGNIGGAYRHMVVPKDTAEEKIAAQVGTLIEELITLYLKANHDL